jgi:hypothetical protein
VDSKYRDGILAVIASGALIGAALILKTESGVNTELTATILTIWPAMIGIFGMIAIELICLYNPNRTQAIWSRRPIQFSSVILVIITGGFALVSDIQWIFTALVWGLTAYLILLIIVIVLGTNPLLRLVSSR